MKHTTIILMLLIASMSMSAMAAPAKPKKGKIKDTQAETIQNNSTQQQIEEEVEPVITEECKNNASVFYENCKNQRYAEAYEPWLATYKECPNYNKVIYTNGAKIIEYLYKNAQTDEERNRLRNLCMEMYDSRIKYFGNDPKYPREYILGLKALDYCEYFPEDSLKLDAYGWLNTSITSMGAKSQVSVLVKYAELSFGLYQSDADRYGSQFIADYAMVTGLLSNHSNAEVAAQQKEYIDNLFALSGAASCDKLDEIFATTVRDNSSDLQQMLKVMKLYRRIKCTESEVYFAAAAAAHKLQPTSESAAGCAQMCLKKEEWQAAINYYEEALRLLANETESVIEDKADFLYNIAFINYMNLKNYPTARQYARESLATMPNQGRCYLLIGFCYAASKPYSNDQYGAKASILNKTVFWAAVDQFQKAKQVDETITETAQKYISDYSRYFPTKEEMFDLPNEFSGSTFIVGGWINEKTTCRPAR